MGAMSKDYSLPPTLKEASSAVKQLAGPFDSDAEGGTIPQHPQVHLIMVSFQYL
jgi:hypothetical protein